MLVNFELSRQSCPYFFFIQYEKNAFEQNAIQQKM